MGMPNKKTSTIDQNIIKKIGKSQNYSLIEGFSGPGGMSLGLEMAGFNLIAAFDYDKPSVETHNYNLGNKCFQADVRNIDGKELLKKYKLLKGQLDVFAGGPPCQGFSKQKKGAHNGDERNSLVLEYIRLVNEIEPKYLIFENVAIFGQKRGHAYYLEMIKKFKNYKLFPNFYNSANYGLAQTRERFIIVGQRIDQKSNFKIPAPTVDKWKTIADVLKNLPEPPEDFTSHPDFPNHQRAKVSDINIKRFSFVAQGGGWKDIPIEYRLKCHKNIDTTKGGWPDVYGRLKMDGQCPTITRGFDSFSRGRYGHPLYDRPITPREAARIQGFPDDYKFIGNRGDVRSQIGNAVPPPLAEAVGYEILKSLLVNDGLLTYEECNDLNNEQLVFAM
jgi:DNA (cytosine-5)-methyltransferase 1